MSKNNQPFQTKYFKYKLTPLMTVLAIAVIVLCGAGIGVSIYRIIVEGGIHGVSDALRSPLLILVCLFCIAIVLGIFIKSQYVVTDKYYITQFGFIKSKFLIKDITSVVLNMDNNKLTVYVGNEYSVLSMNPEWNEAFVQALREVNPRIDYSFTYAESTDGKGKKNKKK